MHINKFAMKLNDYLDLVEKITNKEITSGIYQDSNYVDYTILNKSRMNRWLKKGELNEETVQTIKNIRDKQKWILILEPWCADGSQIAPFIALMADQNKNISFDIRLRDSADSEIDNYLTNGSKSIPKLIIRDKDDNDLLIWGPRPENCQHLFYQLKETISDINQIKLNIQNWYNQDKGESIQNEICGLLKRL